MSIDEILARGLSIVRDLHWAVGLVIWSALPSGWGITGLRNDPEPRVHLLWSMENTCQFTVARKWRCLTCMGSWLNIYVSISLFPSFCAVILGCPHMHFTFLEIKHQDLLQNQSEKRKGSHTIPCISRKFLKLSHISDHTISTKLVFSGQKCLCCYFLEKIVLVKLYN